MNHATTSTASTGPATYAPDASRTLLETEEEGQLLLEALEDAGCRAILEAAGDGALSANEFSDVCGISLSTTYRKLDRLTDAGLLEDGIRIRRSGKHTREYARCVDDIHLHVGGDGGMEMRLGQR